ncbi:MAG: phosphoenolpyruvate synthase [Gammaproteobacteria bacterium]
MKYLVSLNQVDLGSTNIVGGKNASTGEMIQNLTRIGIKVPNGYATTVEAYKEFLEQNELNDRINDALAKLKITKVDALHKTSAQIRRWILNAPFSKEFKKEVATAYTKMRKTAIAVRSSATTEDLSGASFAGAQETYLNIKGLNNVLDAIKHVFASLFTSRAISYRYNHGFEHDQVSISVGLQPMVRSDKGASGIIFTLDTESGFDKVILITGSYGLGEAIVQGQVNPDEFVVYKPNLQEGKFAILQRKLGEKAIKMIYANAKQAKKSIKTVKVPLAERERFCLNDHDVESLAYQALLIEQHYGCAMDIEWAKDGIDGKLYIIQARPETVKGHVDENHAIEHYSLIKRSNLLTKGQSVGQRIGAGIARVITDHRKMHLVQPGDVLVTDMTDPDWEPVMKIASAIVTNRGGRTCHAAIIARELGIPAVVGCVNATQVIKANKPVTVSCAEGDIGYVYDGKLPFHVKKVSVKDMPPIDVRICINMGNPEKAFSTQFLPNNGVGLARLEFIIGNMIGIHPNAALNFATLPKRLQQQMLKKTSAYKNPVEYYVERMREGISMIAAAFYPKEVIFRFSDFKSNEYANLLGGELYEPKEENPMIGFRGASRYHDDKFQACFELECKAFKRVREDMGLTNAQLMVPFVRTVKELKEVLAIIENSGLKRGKNGLKIYMMCEIPSNVLLAREFLKHVDGFSIGSNDLTQLTLGLDRDSSLVANLFDERNDAVKMFLQQAIEACLDMHKYIGICGQAPSDHPDFAKWLMGAGIQCMSLNPDTVVETWVMLAEK